MAHPASTPPLALPAELTIYTVGELHPQWLAWLRDTQAEATVLGAAVAEADAAGVQMLVALERALLQRGQALQVQAPSAALAGACAALGLADWLQALAATPLDSTSDTTEGAAA